MLKHIFSFLLFLKDLHVLCRVKWGGMLVVDSLHLSCKSVVTVLLCPLQCVLRQCVCMPACMRMSECERACVYVCMCKHPLSEMVAKCCFFLCCASSCVQNYETALRDFKLSWMK